MQATGSLDVKEAAAMVMPLMGTARAAVKNAVKGPSKGTGLATIPSQEDGAKGGGGDIVGLTAQACGKRNRLQQIRQHGLPVMYRNS